jgi:hypothetical protein
VAGQAPEFAARHEAAVRCSWDANLQGSVDHTGSDSLVVWGVPPGLVELERVLEGRIENPMAEGLRTESTLTVRQREANAATS